MCSEGGKKRKEKEKGRERQYEVEMVPGGGGESEGWPKVGATGDGGEEVGKVVGEKLGEERQLELAGSAGGEKGEEVLSG